jgi:hypothetical protein
MLLGQFLTYITYFQVYRNLLELLDFDDIGMLYLEFVVTEDKMGVTETVELIGEKLTLYLKFYVYIHKYIYVYMYVYIYMYIYMDMCINEYICL